MRGVRTEFCQALKEPLVLATATPSTPGNLKNNQRKSSAPVRPIARAHS